MKNLNTHKPTIIVIEKDHIDMLVLRTLLGRHINLCIAPDLEMALQVLSEFDFDMIVVDKDSHKRSAKLSIKVKSKNKDITICGFATHHQSGGPINSDEPSHVITKPVCKEDIFNALGLQSIESVNFIMNRAPDIKLPVSIF